MKNKKINKTKRKTTVNNMMASIAVTRRPRGRTLILRKTAYDKYNQQVTVVSTKTITKNLVLFNSVLLTK